MLRSGTKAVVLFLLLAGCHSRVRQARSLIDRGSLDEARSLLNAEQHDHPDDADSRFLLGEIALRENHFQSAKNTFAPLLTSDAQVWRVSQAYRDSVHRLEAIGDVNAMSSEAVEAVALNPLAAPEMCKALIGRARRDANIDWRLPIQAAVRLDNDCRKQALALMRAWVDNADPETATADNLIRIGTEAARFDPAGSLEMARAVRAVAMKIGSVDRSRADDVARRLPQINGAIFYEPETAALRSRVGPIEIHAEEAGDVSGGGYTGSPLEVTKRVMKEIGETITMYEGQYKSYPETQDFGEAWAKCRQFAQSNIHLWDGWGTTFMYVSDGKTARLISAGADKKFDNQSMRLSEPGKILLDEAGADIIWENGRFTQEPIPAAVLRQQGH